MTMIIDIEVKCSVCGKTSEQPALMSTNSWGYPDLDLRPPEMKRSTMNAWIQECPNCGYVAGKLDDELGISEEFLKSDEYVNCGGLDFKLDLAARFYREYLIANEKNDLEQSFQSLHHCMWKCDDAQDPLASDIRRLAIEVADRLIESGFENRDTILVMKADFMRRTGQFDEMIREYRDIFFDDENLNKVIQYQIEKSIERDDGCYTTEEIFAR